MDAGENVFRVLDSAPANVDFANLLLHETYVPAKKVGGGTK